MRGGGGSSSIFPLFSNFVFGGLIALDAIITDHPQSLLQCNFITYLTQNFTNVFYLPLLNLIAVTFLEALQLCSCFTVICILFLSCPHVHLYMPLLNIINKNSFYGITIKNYVKWNWFQPIMFKTNIIPSLLYLNYPKPVEIACCHEYLFRDANTQNNARMPFTVKV